MWDSPIKKVIAGLSQFAKFKKNNHEVKNDE